MTWWVPAGMEVMVLTQAHHRVAVVVVAEARTDRTRALRSLTVPQRGRQVAQVVVAVAEAVAVRGLIVLLRQ